MKRKVMVLLLATLVLSLVIIATPVTADYNTERFTPPTDKSGYTHVEVICITCADGQTQTYVGYGGSVIRLY
jgi:hypothetical protein